MDKQLDRHVILALVLCFVVAPIPTRVGDALAGKAKAKACVPCHSLDGLSRRPDGPNLAGQVEYYLREQLKRYRSTGHVHPVMNVVAGSLSDQDIEDLAAYYGSIPITVDLSE